MSRVLRAVAPLVAVFVLWVPLLMVQAALQDVAAVLGRIAAGG